jgi:hypothetical protein
MICLNLLDATVGCKKDLEKMLEIGGMIAIIELHKSTIINGEQIHKLKEQW